MIQCPDRKWVCKCGETKNDYRSNGIYYMICKKCGQEMEREDSGLVHPPFEDEFKHY